MDIRPDDQLYTYQNNIAKFHFDHPYFQNPKRYGAIILYQIGDLSCTSGYVLEEHVQGCYEISYIAEGSGVFSSNGKLYTVRQGDLFLHRPGERHHGVADEQTPFRYYYIGFQIDTSEQSGEDEESFGSIMQKLDHIAIPLLSNQQLIAPFFTGLFQELLSPGSYSGMMMEAYIKQLILATYRAYCERPTEQYEPKSKSGEAAQIVHQMMHYIDHQLVSIKRLSDMGEKMNYNYAYMSHIFSQETGHTVQAYYNRKRYEKACEWLRAGQLTVTQIAERLQYQSIHSFSKAFRKQSGMSPTTYQTLVSNLKK